MNFRLTNRPARNPADLQADSGTVRYDLDMLVETAGRYVEAEQRKDVVGMNMAVESFERGSSGGWGRTSGLRVFSAALPPPELHRNQSETPAGVEPA